MLGLWREAVEADKEESVKLKRLLAKFSSNAFARCFYQWFGTMVPAPVNISVNHSPKTDLFRVDDLHKC